MGTRQRSAEDEDSTEWGFGIVYVAQIPKSQCTRATTDIAQSSVIDLADVFAVNRLNIVRKNLKISAQTHEPFLRYTHYKL